MFIPQHVKFNHYFISCVYSICRMYYFYVLQSRSDKKHYYGSTDNLKRRLLEHEVAKVAATKYRLPLELIYYEAYNHLELARNREQQIKNSGASRKAIHERIRVHSSVG